MYFNKVLIANRGEIARRIIKTCKELNIKTVAIYSEIDSKSLHVKEADESYYVGPSQAQKSYLNIPNILKVAKEAGVDAIHPGYGFLSENTEFAKVCEQENITFIGPDSKLIELMGDKLESRKQMEEAGVPVIPGSSSLNTIEEAKAAANKLGYPLMLKASAGGGGVGLSAVNNESELEANFKSVVDMAGSLFKNDTVYLEKLITNPRHIEVQIAADHFGNIIHLYERECSIQRRHQKVIEESPSPFLNDEIRNKLFEVTIQGVKQIGYNNVGTMEFIFDGDKNFYFLEMNTRLQVEHAVTEEIVGIDLVEWQLSIAAGKELPLSQAEINKTGHSIECRIYAEDPKTHFPSPGEIKDLNINDNIARYDFGIEKGSIVSPFYDPMVGKIISYGSNRDKAISVMNEALLNTEITGIKTNIPLLLDVLSHKKFTDGDYTTSFFEEY